METRLKQTGNLNQFLIEMIGKSRASNPGQADKNFTAVKTLLKGKTPKKNMFFLFMSHKSGDHGLTAHKTIKSLQSELQSVVDLINEDATESQKEDNNRAVQEATGDGSYAELSDSTWFDVFELEI